MVPGCPLLLLACLLACGGSTKDADGDGVLDASDCDPGDPTVGAGQVWNRDADGDGHGDAAATFTACGTPADGVTDTSDCDDSAADVHPGATEVWYDGADEDCSGGSDFDQDGDGWDRDEECDDTDPARYPDPEVAEIWYDGVDDDCDGNDGDQDGDGWYVDGYPHEVPVGYTGFVGDCADDPAGRFPAINGFPDLGSAEVNPGATETPYDGVDQDCAGDDDFDADADGFRTDDWPDLDGGRGEDCDDAEPDSHPGARDAWYDGVDSDCAGNDDFDQDYDGSALDADCDDVDAGVHPGAVERCDTSTDEDCDGTENGAEMAGCTPWYADGDADGFGSGEGACQCVAAGAYDSAEPGDCDDADSEIHPGASEVCDGADQDCDGEADEGLGEWYVDADGDGWGTGSPGCAGAGRVEVDGDCDDARAAAYPGAPELCDAAPDDCTTAGTWTGDAEIGLAATEVGGAWTDVTGAVAGTASAPAAYTLPVDGTLWLCPGRWYATLAVPAGAGATGVYAPGGASDTLLDGGAARSVVTAAQAGMSTRIEGVTLTNGAAARGGGIAVTAGELALVDATVTGNVASTEGGGVYVTYATLTVSGARVTGNTAGRAGGGLYATESVVAIVDTTIDANAVSSGADGYGGGVAFGAVTSGSLALTSSRILDNTLTAAGSYGEGAGVYVYSYSGDGVDVRDVEIAGNATTGPDLAYGGGLRLVEGGGADLTLDGLDVHDNSVTGDSAAYGAGVHLYQGAISAMAILGSTIRANTARSDGVPAGGGVLYGSVATGTFTLSGSAIEGNQTVTSTGVPAGTGAGGYFEPGGAAVVEGCTVSGNTSNLAGLVFAPQAAASGAVRSTVVSGNASMGIGYFPVGASTTLSLEDTEVSDHTGYGVYVATDAGTSGDLSCVGSSASRGGLYRSGYAGLVAACGTYGGACTFAATACDFGPEGTSDDNTTTDVWWDAALYDGWTDDATFVCTSVGCS